MNPFEISPASTVISSSGYYTAKPGQSVYDICIQTYGSLDFLFKLITDNNLVTVNPGNLAGRQFTFDKTKIKNSALYQYNKSAGINYATLYQPEANAELEDGFSYSLEDDGSISLRDE